MGRELQKKKNRSSINKVKLKAKSKKTNLLGNAVVAANWNQKETLTQNYRRLGLTSRLNGFTGGMEKNLSKTSTESALAIANVKPTVLEPREVRVERDPETGRIVRVLNNKKENPLNDQLLSDDEEDVERPRESVRSTGIIAELERQASRVPEKKPRQQSAREREWLERLVNKYGDDTQKMARDMKLNPMQQTASDIGKRIKKWQSQS